MCAVHQYSVLKSIFYIHKGFHACLNEWEYLKIYLHHDTVCLFLSFLFVTTERWWPLADSVQAMAKLRFWGRCNCYRQFVKAYCLLERCILIFKLGWSYCIYKALSGQDFFFFQIFFFLIHFQKALKPIWAAWNMTYRSTSLALKAGLAECFQTWLLQQIFQVSNISSGPTCSVM